MSAPPDLTDKGRFPFWQRENLRFSDTDMLGHVNNVAFAALIESGRVAYTCSVLLPEWRQPVLAVMARVEIDYRAELHYPAAVDIGCCLVSVGRSSFVIGNAVFRGDLCAATALTVLVFIDRTTRRSTPMPDDLRGLLNAHLWQAAGT